MASGNCGNLLGLRGFSFMNVIIIFWCPEMTKTEALPMIYGALSKMLVFRTVIKGEPFNVEFQ